MSSWVKIEVEFLEDMHDPNEVVQFLMDHFKVDGLPTGTVRLIGREMYDPLTPQPEDIKRLADKHWAIQRAQINAVSGKRGTAHILAIKDLRAETSISLREAKDAIDAAINRNPF